MSDSSGSSGPAIRPLHCPFCGGEAPFAAAETVERARFAGAQFDFVWREGGERRRAAFHSMGAKARLADWVRRTSGDGAVKLVDGDAVSMGRAVFNSIVAVAVLAWIAGMIFLIVGREPRSHRPGA